ncbi:MAG TPA: response regulator transcription factor [Nitrospirae bacterium]|nr:response regulator transcription factor [Nitrospirota bacterium]
MALSRNRPASINSPQNRNWRYVQMCDIISYMIKVFIIEDHAIVRDGLKALFNSVEGYSVIGEAENGVDAIKVIKEKSPHVIILDMNLPLMHGSDVIKELRPLVPSSKIIILTGIMDVNRIAEAIRRGASGVIMKPSPFSELREAIVAILKGGLYFSPSISRQIIKKLSIEER